jgi:polyisoprenoid-binding protein YceI
MPWQIDPAHSQVQFSVRHMMISNVRGRFESFTSQAEVDEENPLNSKLLVQIDAASITTREPQRDGHLKAPDFLDVATYPTITFRATGGEKADASHGKLFGDLTIRDTTRPVVLDVEYNGQAKSPWGTTSAGFSARTKFNRKDWGLTWNQALETGGLLVGDEITIDIEVEVVNKP